MTELATLFQDLEGSYAKQLETVLATADKDVEKGQRKTTIATRKEAYKKAVSELDVELLDKVGTAMSTYMDSLVTIAVGQLTPEQANDLMREYEQYKVAAEFLATRNETFKALVFALADEEVGPNENYRLKATETGKMFCREGAGRGNPSIDPEKFIEAAGLPRDAVFDTVEIPEQIIPASTEEQFSQEKLMKLVQANPALLQHVKAALVPGKDKNARFIVRDIPADEQES